MQLSCTTLRIYEYALSKHFFSSFPSRKNGKKRHGFKVENKIILFKTLLDLFNFIDLEPRYCTSSIGHPFNLALPVIIVFSRSTEGSGKKICMGAWVCVCARARVCVCECVCVRAPRGKNIYVRCIQSV